MGREGVTFITAFPHAIDEETLSIPESFPDLLEEEESQPRSSLDSFEGMWKPLAPPGRSYWMPPSNGISGSLGT